jgi:hypothetical protein
MRRRTRDTRETLTMRLSGKEREQIAKAAELQGMPLRSYLRWAALQHSAVAIGKATVTSRPRRRERPAPERKVPERKLLVIDPEPSKAHYVDGELVRR